MNLIPRLYPACREDAFTTDVGSSITGLGWLLSLNYIVLNRALQVFA